MTDFMAPVQQPVFDYGELMKEAVASDEPIEQVSVPEPLFGTADVRQDSAIAAIERMVAGQDDGSVRQAPDHVSTVQRLAPNLVDPAQLGRAAAGVQTYAETLQDLPPEARLPAAQVDLDKFDAAVESGKIEAPLWSKMKSAPETVTDEEFEQLNLLIKQVGDATRSIDSADLTFEGGKIAKLVQSGADMVPYVQLDDPTKALKAALPGMPALAPQAEPGVYVMPDGRVGAFGDEEQATAYRTMYPAATRGGAIQWNIGRPRTVLDLEMVRDSLGGQIEGHQTATWSNAAWKQGHPATRADHVIMINVPDGPIDAKLREYGRIEDPKLPALIDGLAAPDPDDVPDYFEADEDELAPDRAARRQRQVALVVDSAGAVAQTAARLKKYGYDLDAVYTNQPAPDGFTAVREHVYQDVANTMVVRTADPEVASYNGYSAWVPADKAEGLPTSNPTAQRKREAGLSQLAPGAFSVDGHAVLMLPPEAEPDTNPTKVLFQGAKPSYVGMRFSGGVPEVTPAWGEAEPQGFEIFGKVSDNQIEVKVEPNTDLETAIRFADTLGDLGMNPKRVRILVGDEIIRPA